MRSIVRASFLIIGLLINSCSRHVGVYGDGEVIPIDFDNYEQLALSDLFSKIEVIELEGNEKSFLTDPVSLQVNDGKYYLKDHHAVYAFNEDGTFLYNTSIRRGRAKNEYFSINDYFVVDGNIYILDYNGKILIYDSDLNIKEIYQIEKNEAQLFTDFTPLSQDIIALSGISENAINWSFYSKSKKKIVDTYCLTDIRTGGYVFGQSRKYITNDSLVLYRLPDNGTSYCSLNRIDHSVYERFCYDFGKQTFNSSIVDKSDKISSYLKEHPKEYVLAMETLLNNNILLTRLGYLEVLKDPREGTFRLSFYSLENGKQRLVNQFFKDGKWLYNLDYMDDSCIYSCIIDYSYNDFLYEDSLLDDKSRKILKGVNDNTNCLIFKYYFKEGLL